MWRGSKFAVAAAVLALLVGACGSDDDGGGSAAGGGGSDSSSSKPSLEAVAEACQAPYAEAAKEEVDTSAYKKPEPWTLAMAGATTTGSSYIVYMIQEVKAGVADDKRFGDFVITDANFNATKQVSDIESLIQQKVDAILLTPTDNKALQPALKKAMDAGIPVIPVTSGFDDSPNVVAGATVDLYSYYVTSVSRLFDAMGGKGEVAQILTLPGSNEDAVQKEAVNCVLKQYPDIKLVDSQFGKYATAQSKTIADAWVQRFPNLKGVISVYGEPSLGVASAYKQAGRLDQIKISPGNQSNGWLKFVAANPSQNLGGVGYPVTLGRDAVKVAGDILSGESVPRATFIGGEFFPPDKMKSLANPDEPDSWWPNDLPEDLQP